MRTDLGVMSCKQLFTTVVIAIVSYSILRSSNDSALMYVVHFNEVTQKQCELKMHILMSHTLLIRVYANLKKITLVSLNCQY